jgi:3-(3-hydroxy-phenyl)propionate hydroxylase
VTKVKPVIVVGAGPVGLCLALALAQAGIPVTIVETMSDDNFLSQVPRAGSNHPSTLEFFDKIGLYDRLVPRGIVAPKFQYWDRQSAAVISEFDHVHLKDDTRFPFVLQCERIKIIEEALKMAKAHPLITVRMSTTFTGFSQSEDDVTVMVTTDEGESEAITGSFLASAEGARSLARKDLSVKGLPIPSAPSISKSPMISPSTALPSEITFPIRSNTRTCFIGKVRPTAGASIFRPIQMKMKAN